MIEKITSCREALKSAATAFRLGMEGQAGQDLVRFIDGFLPVLQDPHRLDCKEITPLLNEVLAAQSRKDYLRVADLLEYEVSLLIEGV
ncbi:MAG: hypothetical protein JRI32_06420, partial [Deltaproteobacteria bacterium]|nr:hypothetical protein [Deltaproteobacteria bacterium]